MSDRIDVLKTYKTYVGGQFPRSESGLTYKIKNQGGDLIANACRCSRKDIRDAVGAARSAFPEWKSRSAYHRGQILYRIAEMLEGRKEQFVNELINTGLKKSKAILETETAIDRLVYYAGWTDKYQQVFGTINPVASAHFNFSNPEPTGVVGLLAPDSSPLTALISMIAPVIAGGNSCILLASETNPLPAISFGETLHVSDVPGGVVNILSGYRNELIPHLTKHMDLNAIWNTNSEKEIRKQIDKNAALNIKRVYHTFEDDWYTDDVQNPYHILEFQEIKTTWHPAGY
jgi:acyl-CoA reductase-like NAD-dependent aldehyde dehydrogenase